MSRGRPKTDIAEILRRQIWYKNVKRLSEMTDYELDIEFDLIQDRSGKHRRRFFERLRKFNEMPFRGRTLEFIDLVDSHDKLKGTAELYTSTLWDLVSANILSVEELRHLIVKGMRKLGLLKVPSSMDGVDNTFKNEDEALSAFLFAGNLTEYNSKAYEKEFMSCMTQVEVSLDTLAISGALYREAYFATNLRIALLLENAIFFQLKVIKNSDWMPNEVCVDFETLVAERILRFSNSPRQPPTEYLELFTKSECKKSAAGYFLAWHDKLMGWE
jgi:hypothetical protein